MSDGNQTYRDDHCDMHRNIKSLCSIPETNSVLGQLYFKTNKFTEKEMRFVIIRGGDGGGEIGRRQSKTSS